MQREEKRLYRIMTILIIATALFALISGGPIMVLKGTLSLQASSARLISDFTLHTPQVALFNATTVGALGLIIVFYASISLSGPTLACILTMMGFSFFGNTLLNCIPIIVGVWIASRVAGKTFGAYSIIALFGTALGPLVTYVMFSIGLPYAASIPLGLFCGVLAGFLLPAIASPLLILHQGYNLYNMGFSCGFLGLFWANILRAAGKMEDLTIAWNGETSLPMLIFIPAVSFLFLIFARFNGRAKQNINELRAIQLLTGRLPFDFFDTGQFGGTLVNISLLGLAGWAYVLLIGAPLNGPVVGGILTLMAFGGFGKTLRNTFPIALGVLLSTLLFGKSLTDPGPLLAILFGTTLAPIAGQFGVLAGIAAGAVHLVMVEATALWHGGLDLYNNGFAGGLTAALFVAILQWYKTNSAREDFD
ncbi:MAG TPA: DUF1576 domain-containing protein [Sphaerochaeta sp.]|nr:DUF1576 domain-containing protein [Sphaerochaeta sp.]HOQ94709.1 DUF1576 domain-containing protein [Sphaerochaeta sp.]HPK47663.1 DUF1576 domain-containing protein [Sphaerochaeta sp.]